MRNTLRKCLLVSSEVWRLGRHGAFDKKTDELRVSCNAYYCGTHFRRQESFEMVPREIIERNPPRFSQLLGWNDLWAFTDRRGPIPLASRSDPETWESFANGHILHPPPPKL